MPNLTTGRGPALAALAGCVLLAACAGKTKPRTPEPRPAEESSPPAESAQITSPPADAAVTPVDPGTRPHTAGELNLREVFPHVRIDRDARVVEFDTFLSPALAPDVNAPLFFLELVCCTPDTREHETFVVCRARPSHIHAALLAIGLQPGHPGAWRMQGGELEPVDPTGDRVNVRMVVGDEGAEEREIDPVDWIISADGVRRFDEAMADLAAKEGRPAPGWVFAGSRLVAGDRAMRPTDPETSPDRSSPAEVYDADESGTVIGLTTFGSEVIAWSQTISPDASVQEPEWVADFSRLPPAETPVRVRIRPAP